jgi:hypothetical protein
VGGAGLNLPKRFLKHFTIIQLPCCRRLAPDRLEGDVHYSAMKEKKVTGRGDCLNFINWQAGSIYFFLFYCCLFFKAASSLLFFESL